MSLTRRQFIGRTAVAAAGSFLGSGLIPGPWMREALAATLGDRYLVVLYLDGGNDGLNTVAPYDNGGGSLRTAYEAARQSGVGGLRLTPADLLVPALPCLDPNTGAQLALHPGLSGLRDLYDLGKLAVIQGCGYPDSNLSHAQSRAAWATGTPPGSGSTATGWVGRYLAANYGANDIPAVSVRDAVAAEFAQTATSVLAVRRLRRFGFPYDGYNLASDKSAKRAAFAALAASAAGSTLPIARYVGDSAASTLTSSESYPQAEDLYLAGRSAWNDAYGGLGTGTARDLREVAQMIYGVTSGVPNVNARFFEVRNGGYDTHSNQGGAEIDGRHYSLHREVGDAVKLFYEDCADMGVANRVTLLVWSEFGRRIPQNDSGTDHGSVGPMFVLGGSVVGGVYGNHPNIDAAALDPNGNVPYTQSAADPFRTTDMRDVYGTLTKHWLNMPAAQIQASLFPPDTGDPALYWTAPDFDLGFV